MKKKNIGILAGIVASSFALYFLFGFFYFVTTDNAQIEARTLMLVSKVSGFIEKVNVEENSKVKKDDVLIEIDVRDFANSLTQAKSELSSVETRMKDAEKNFKRISDLYKKNVVSQQQFDMSQTSYNDLKAKFDSLSAAFSQAQLNLDNTKIKAPTDGYIAKKSVEVGQLASPGIPLLGFVSSEDRWVTANFKETELKDIKIGNKVDISVDAIPGTNFEGEVDSISAATGATFTLLPPDNATGNFTKVVQRVPVRIKLPKLTDKDRDQLRAGLSAVVKVHVR